MNWENAKRLDNFDGAAWNSLWTDTKSFFLSMTTEQWVLAFLGLLVAVLWVRARHWRKEAKLGRGEVVYKGVWPFRRAVHAHPEKRRHRRRLSEVSADEMMGDCGGEMLASAESRARLNDEMWMGTDEGKAVAGVGAMGGMAPPPGPPFGPPPEDPMVGTPIFNVPATELNERYATETRWMAAKILDQSKQQFDSALELLIEQNRQHAAQLSKDQVMLQETLLAVQKRFLDTLDEISDKHENNLQHLSTACTEAMVKAVEKIAEAAVSYDDEDEVD